MPYHNITVEIVNDYSNGTAMVRFPDGQSVLTAKSNLVEVVADPVPAVEENKTLEDLTVPQLQEKAIELGIEYKGLKKAELVEAISKKLDEQAAETNPSTPVTPPTE